MLVVCLVVDLAETRDASLVVVMAVVWVVSKVDTMVG